jgi:hypothetical protein
VVPAKDLDAALGYIDDLDLPESRLDAEDRALHLDFRVTRSHQKALPRGETRNREAYAAVLERDNLVSAVRMPRESCPGVRGEPLVTRTAGAMPGGCQRSEACASRGGASLGVLQRPQEGSRLCHRVLGHAQIWRHVFRAGVEHVVDRGVLGLCVRVERGASRKVYSVVPKTGIEPQALLEAVRDIKGNNKVALVVGQQEVDV